MSVLDDLARRLRALDGRGYKAYKEIRGAYEANGFRLFIDHVQGDPYARPSRLRAHLPPTRSALPEWARRTDVRRRATADFLNRAFAEVLEDASTDRGSGKSGLLTVLAPGQEVLERTSVGVAPDGAVEARFRAGLPARGRRVRGRRAAEMLTDVVPAAIERCHVFTSLDADRLRRHVETVEDANALRRALEPHRLVAFVADGAILPRRSGVDDRPLAADAAVPFEAPDSLRVTLETPNAGPITGMGLPAGVTLIVGGGYHGKSTLLRAIERGVYDHIPDDGRERVVAVPDAVKVRAEDGRRVVGTDIGNFIGRLPNGQDTRHFRTENASGSTSQAANIVEALEVGARCLLMDEDTSATNFMIRDARMQALVADADEPITPFIDRARQMADELGTSTVLVVGGSGDCFDIADTVIAMRSYRPEDATEEAHRIARQQPTGRQREGGGWRPITARVPQPESIDPSRGRRNVSVKVRAIDRVLFGTEALDLGAVEQIVETAQTRAMANALVWAREHAIDGERTVGEALASAMAAIGRDGLEIIHPHEVGEHAMFRVFELAALLNRLRSLETRPAGDHPRSGVGSGRSSDG